MNIEKLIKQIDGSSAEQENLDSLFVYCVKDDELINLDASSLKSKVIEEYILGINESKHTEFGNKLSELINIGNTKYKFAIGLGDQDYITNVNKILTIIDIIISNYKTVMKHQAELLAERKSAESNNQGDESRARLDINGIKTDINRIQEDINSNKKHIEDLTRDFDGKVFQVLLNTVTILGIFVAIAFAGFGTITIFTDIDVETWMQSRESFVKNTFVLFATALLSYNLLLLLIYFIYKIARPQALLIGEDKNSNENKTPPKFANGEIKLTPFVWIDICLLIIVIALFIWSVIFI